MSETIILKNSTPIQIRKSARATRIRIAVYCDGTVMAVQPGRVSTDRFMKALEEKYSWIQEKLDVYRKKGFIPRPARPSAAEYKKLREQAREIAHERVAHFNQYYGFSYGKIFIKNQKTRWGSCSAKKNLNFNYRIAALPSELQDYLVVHELCHLKEMNHGPNFWKLVAEQVSNYKELSKQLKRHPL